MRRLRPLVVLAACGLVIGCGQASSRHSADGAALFAGNCRSCHSLLGNESRHTQGGDLLNLRMSRAQLESFTRVMPTRPLSQAEIDAIVDYVLREQARTPAH